MGEPGGHGSKADAPTEDEKRDDREQPPDPEAPGAPAAIAFAARMQDLLYYLIAAILMALAIAALVRLGIDFFTHDEPFAQRVTGAVNGVLFVVIVMELLRTILAQLEDAAFQLKPFLIVGIISAVRHILTVGAELSIAAEEGGDLVHRADVELAVNALVVLALVVGLVLVRKSE